MRTLRCVCYFPSLNLAKVPAPLAPLAGSRNIHQQNAAMMMRTTTRTTMTTMMRTSRTTTKIEKPAFDCCWCAQNQFCCYFVGLSVDFVASAKFEWSNDHQDFSYSIVLQPLHSAPFDFQNAMIADYWPGCSRHSAHFKTYKMRCSVAFLALNMLDIGPSWHWHWLKHRLTTTSQSQHTIYMAVATVVCFWRPIWFRCILVTRCNYAVGVGLMMSWRWCSIWCLIGLCSPEKLFVQRRLV